MKKLMLSVIVVLSVFLITEGAFAKNEGKAKGLKKAEVKAKKQFQVQEGTTEQVHKKAAKGKIKKAKGDAKKGKSKADKETKSLLNKAESDDD